jgi:hypothetical protein
LQHLIPSNLTPKYHKAILCICSPKQEIANRTLVRLVVLIVPHTGNFSLIYRRENYTSYLTIYIWQLLSTEVNLEAPNKYVWNLLRGTHLHNTFRSCFTNPSHQGLNFVWLTQK